LVLVLVLVDVSAFHYPHVHQLNLQERALIQMHSHTRLHSQNEFFPFPDVDESLFHLSHSNGKNEVLNLMPIQLGLLVSNFMPLEPANAKGGEYGAWEGRIASMMHPMTMSALFLTSLYAGYLGLQWRRIRTIGDELKQMNRELPILVSGISPKFPLSSVITNVKSELSICKDEKRVSLLNKDLITLQSISELDNKYEDLLSNRKNLQQQNLRDKHWAAGSIVLGVGVGVSILGGFNTYLRVGKLFPGPHLYAGMAITSLWALGSSLVPAMQKGNDIARSAHIVINALVICLFAWQVTTGIAITLKVIEFTKFP